MILSRGYLPARLGGAWAGSILPHADGMRLVESRRRLRSIMGDLGTGPVGRMIDDAYTIFDLPAVALRKDLPSSPSQVVLSYPVPIIRWSDLTRYTDVLGFAKAQSRDLRMMDDIMQDHNRWILRTAKRTRILYRGMTIRELEIVAGAGGAFGRHRRTKYAAETDFSSFSIDAAVAAAFAIQKGRLGLVVEVDISGLDGSEYAAAGYQARNAVRAVRCGRHVFSPYEEFGGSMSGLFLREAEIRLLAGSRPRIISVAAMRSDSPGFGGRLARAVAHLECIHGSKITVKYAGAQP